MKKNYLFLLLLSNIIIAQIPTGYYDSATGTGYVLKTQLHNIIKNYNPQSYNSLWNLYTHIAYRDNYYENDGTLLDIYSEKISLPETYNYTSVSQECGSTSTTYEGLCYNREHLVPESFFEPYFISIGVDTSINTLAYYTKNDAHFIPPTDVRVNAWRGNLPFGRVYATTLNSCTGGDTSPFLPSNLPCTTTNDSKIGYNNNSGYSAGYTGNVFEPIDEFKGDIARAVLYFVTRYEDVLPQMYTACTNTTAKAMFDGSANQGLKTTFLNIMKTWHENDPVSTRETAINNRIYSHQNNRNPFIDHPEWVETIWGTTMNVENLNLQTEIKVYPNPVVEHKITLESNIDLDELKIYNINNQIIKQIKKPSLSDGKYNIENIPTGFYFLEITSEFNTIIKKIIVN